MRIDELHLLAYGPFTNKKLDFSKGNFQLIFGQNEAGKSSMLRAIESLLYGIHTRTKDSFLHKNADLRIGGVLSAADGTKLAFKRRKGSKGTLRTLDEDENTLPDNSLDVFLRGVDQDRFTAIHCIDHDELRAGGEMMLQLKGLAGDSLLAAGSGTNFVSLQSRLQEDIDRLYVSRKKTRLKLALDGYSEAKKERAQCEVSVKEWESLKAEHDKLERNLGDSRKKCKELDVGCRRLLQLRSALPMITKWKSRKSELAELGGRDFEAPASDYSIEQRQECEREITQKTAMIDSLHERLSTLQEQLDNITELPEILARAEEIEDIQQRIGSQKEFIEERSKVDSEIATSKREVEQRLVELGLEIEFSEIDTRRIQHEHRSAIGALATEEKALRQAVSKVQGDLATSQRNLEALQEQLLKCGEEIDFGTLADEIRRAEHVVSATAEIEQLSSNLKMGDSQIARLLQELPYWDGSANDSVQRLVDAAVPMRETIDRFQSQFEKLENRRDTTRLELKAKTDEHVKLQQAIETASGVMPSLSEKELLAARERRQRGWRLVRQAWLETEDAAAIREFAGEERLDFAYETSVRESDDIADRQRLNADAVAQQAERESQATSLRKQIEALQDELDKLASEQQELERAWHSEWERSGIQQINSPLEMRSWVQNRTELINHVSAQGDLQNRRDEFQRRRNETHEALKQSLSNANLDAEGSLETLLMRANAALQASLEKSSAREQLVRDNDRLRDQVESQKLAEQQAKEELGKWEESWAEAMSWIDCKPSATGVQASARVEAISLLTKAFDKYRQQSERLDFIAQETQRFATDVKEVANQAAFEAGDSSAIEIAKQLRRQLDEARQRHQSANNLRADIETNKEETSDLQERAKTLELELAGFVKLANVGSSEDLPRFERLLQLSGELRELVDSIQSTGGGIEFDEFVEMAGDRDQAELDAAIQDLQGQIDAEREASEAIRVELADVEDRMNAIDGSSKFALADQRAVNFLSEAHDIVGEYTRLRIAQCILQQQVERYRENNKDTLLSKASEYFATMTGNEFTGLEHEFDEKGQAIIVGIRRGTREEVDVSAMSDGTRDPMYLSLRLAYLQRRLSQFGPMPLIVDDILIHLDDQRALATLQVLASLADEMQILFFTHHQRIRDLAEANLSGSMLQIHDLERRQLTTTTTASDS